MMKYFFVEKKMNNLLSAVVTVVFFSVKWKLWPLLQPQKKNLWAIVKSENILSQGRKESLSRGWDPQKSQVRGREMLS